MTLASRVPWRIAVLILVVSVFMVVPTLIGQPLDPYAAPRFLPPSTTYLLGTDYLGRDLAIQILNAGRTTLIIALVATGASFAIGLATAVVASLLAGLPGMIIGRTMDALVAIPPLIIGFVLIAGLGSSNVGLIVTIIVVEFCRVFRTLRGPVSQVIAEPFVMMSRVRGEGLWYLVRYDIWESLRPYARLELANRFVSCIMFLSALSVLGLGAQPPDSDWGTLIKENSAALLFGSPAPIFPGLFIVLISLLTYWAIGPTGREKP